jgi:hypothetical protein
MAGPSDKARFYLEQSATELNELERKKIFTRVRIFALAQSYFVLTMAGRDQLHSQETLRLRAHNQRPRLTSL